MSAWVDTLYLLCFLTSLFCCLLLIKSYRRNRSGLLLWSASCFVLLALNNLLMIVDLIFLPSIDLSAIWQFVALCAVSTLLVGFIREFV